MSAMINRFMSPSLYGRFLGVANTFSLCTINTNRRLYLLTTEGVMALVQFILLAFAIGVGAIVFTKSVLFESQRRALDRCWPKIGYAAKCTFCMIGWTSLVAVVVYRPLLLSQLFAVFWLADVTVSWFALWGVSVLCYRILWPFLKKNAPKMRIHFSR